MPLTKPNVELPDSYDAVLEYFLEKRWTDGLPIVPPTEDRVARFLRGVPLDPEHIVAHIPPRNGAATVLHVAVNAVMAGATVEVFQAIVAALPSIALPQFNLAAIQTTTNPVAVAGFANGDVRDELGLNSGSGCLGPGNRSNASLGRTLRLLLMNVGGAEPGGLDPATQGQPGKYTMFFAENEEASPWEPFSVEHGLEHGASAITFFGASGTQPMLDPSTQASDLARSLGRSMRSPTINDYMFDGEPWIIMAPEHAMVFAKAGMSKADTKQAVWEHTSLRLHHFSAGQRPYVERTWAPLVGSLQDRTAIPICSSPDRMQIVVAGGASVHSVFMPTFGSTQHVMQRL